MKIKAKDLTPGTVILTVFNKALLVKELRPVKLGGQTVNGLVDIIVETEEGKTDDRRSTIDETWQTVTLA